MYGGEGATNDGFDPLNNNVRFETISECEKKIAEDAPWALKTLLKKNAMDLVEAFGLDKLNKEMK